MNYKILSLPKSIELYPLIILLFFKVEEQIYLCGGLSLVYWSYLYHFWTSRNHWYGRAYSPTTKVTKFWHYLHWLEETTRRLS